MPQTQHVGMIFHNLVFDSYLAGGFNPLKNAINWDDYSQYMEKCYKPPTSYVNIGGWFAIGFATLGASWL